MLFTHEKGGFSKHVFTVGPPCAGYQRKERGGGEWVWGTDAGREGAEGPPVKMRREGKLLVLGVTDPSDSKHCISSSYVTKGVSSYLSSSWGFFLG